MTPKERAAMQLALEALEFCKKWASRIGFDVAITALREALAEQAEQEPVATLGMIHPDWFEEVCEKCNGNSNTPLYAAPVQQAEQEPVHSVGDNYEHFTSYMGAEHSALLCQAYFDGANAPHEEYEAYMKANPAKQHPSKG